jgi:hypothetical protein
MANDLVGVIKPLAVKINRLNDMVRRQARMIIIGTADYAVKSGVCA